MNEILAMKYLLRERFFESFASNCRVSLLDASRFFRIVRIFVFNNLDLFPRGGKTNGKIRS